MAQRFLNKVQLIGNLTSDPVLKQIEGHDPVCNFSLATNRYWKSNGVDKEEVQYHRIVTWSKLAELCAQLLSKGRKIYIEGRLSSRKFTDKTGAERETTEIVLDDMILLDYKPKEAPAAPPVTSDNPF